MAKQDYSYSLDKDSRLINIEDAIKGNEYYCPCCKAPMIPRQGGLRTWHFAHKSNYHHCSYETYLHKIAKKRICDCFNESSIFYIILPITAKCSKHSDCPLGKMVPCSWSYIEKVNLKDYYNLCEEEAPIDKYRADLLISKQHNGKKPILIEIYVTHKSSEEKINSGNRIIEIHIESEEDIDQIVTKASIGEDDKTRFYNFETNITEYPDKEHQAYQAYKYHFWMDSNGLFHFNNVCDEPQKCLSPQSNDIINAKFLIESPSPIDWDLALCKLAKSGIKNCRICKFYHLNNSNLTTKCELTKSKNPLNALSCNLFTPICKDYNQKCEITIR